VCLGIPGEVLDVRDRHGMRYAKVRFGGITREVCVTCVPDVAPAEFVLVHVGMAISKIDPDEAARTYRVLEELGQTAEVENE